MNISNAIAQFLGIIFVVLGASVAIHREGMNTFLKELSRNRGFLWVIGLVPLFMGSALVVLNNVLPSGLPLLITIVGWGGLIQGCVTLFFPGFAGSLYGKFSKSLPLPWGIGVFLLGLILLYLGLA